MHGPSLTPQEAVAWVAQRVRRLEDHGLDLHQATQLVAAENGIVVEKVRWCVETTFPASTVRRLPSTRRHRGAAAVAAAA
jgi:hypothetical protein